MGNLTSPGKGEGADGAKEEPKDFFSGLVSGITDVAAGAEKAAREVDTSALRSYVCLIAGLIQIPVRPEIVILKPLLGDRCTRCTIACTIIANATTPKRSDF